MKVIPIEIISGLRGKVCNHSDMYVRQNRRNKAMYTGKLCNPYDGPIGDKQRSLIEKFKAVRLAVDAVMADAEKLQEYTEQFKAQKKYSTLRGFIFAKEYEKLNGE